MKYEIWTEHDQVGIQLLRRMQASAAPVAGLRGLRTYGYPAKNKCDLETVLSVCLVHLSVGEQGNMVFITYPRSMQIRLA